MLGHLVSAMFAGFLSDAIGRKMSLLLDTGVFFLGFLLLNYPGPHDEILLSLLAAYVLGPNKVMLSANIVYKKWWQEWIGPMLMGRLHDLKQKHTQ